MSGERIPPLAPEKLDEAQREAIEEVRQGPRGAFSGPFPVLVRSPELMNRVQRVGEYLRFGGCLPARAFELTILLVARAYDQPVEWSRHSPIAVERGIDADLVEQIGAGVELTPDHPLDRVVIAFVGQLLAGGRVDDQTFADADAELGEQGVVELSATAGYYITLALVMNVAGTPSPGGPQLPPRSPSNLEVSP